MNNGGGTKKQRYYTEKEAASLVSELATCWRRRSNCWLKYDTERAKTEKGMSSLLRRRRSTATVSRMDFSVFESYLRMRRESLSCVL